MDEKDLKNIEAPTQAEISKKRKRVNTYIFTVAASIFNLVFTVAVVFALILLLSFIVRSVSPDMSKEVFSKWVKPIMWISVIAGIASSYLIQNSMIRGIIKLFNLDGKLDDNFIERYSKQKEEKK